MTATEKALPPDVLEMVESGFLEILAGKLRVGELVKRIVNFQAAKEPHA